MKQEILMVFNNEKAYCELKKTLENSFFTKSVENLDDAIRLIANGNYCLVIMDASMSEADGQRLLRIIQVIKPTPILLISLKTNCVDRLAALKAGANAYMYVPFSLEECVEQAKTLIRLYNDLKVQKQNTEILAFGTELIIDPIKRKVFLKETPIELARKEFDLLYLMASHPERVFTREQLYDRIWDADYSINVDDSVKAHIKTLRRKMSDIDCIQNVWGVGYRFSPPEKNNDKHIS